MNRTLIISIVMIALGFLIAMFIFSDSESSQTLPVKPVETNKFELPDLESRIITLETQLLEERIEREQLQEMVEMMSLGQWAESEPERPLRAREISPNEQEEASLSPEEQRQQALARRMERQNNFSARRIQRLEESGFTPERVSWILQREEEIRLDNLNAQWEQRRQAFIESGESERDPLRTELGDSEYERYLEATGRPTRVNISNLVDNSQAVSAGFQVGDEIVRYNGERVFNYNDLNTANVKGELGENVVVDIIRQGTPMQLTVERGPLGIVGGRRGRRR